MANTLIIIGNGFDLDLGWKTSYEDFYQAKKDEFAEWNRMQYIKDMVQGEYWFNLEGYIRKSLIEMSQERVKEMIIFWMFCCSRLLEYFNPRTDDQYNNIFNTNKESCAYKFLKSVTEKSSIVIFNYTDPFAQNNIPVKAKEYIHIHGDITKAVRFTDIKLGADKSVIDQNSIAKDNSILSIIKSYENKYIEKFSQLLKSHKNIIFYGHSLAQADADYFKPYFKHVISKDISGQNIYLVTKNTSSLQQIKDNLKQYQIEYDDILFSKCNVIPVYTEEGINSKDFQQLIKIL